MLILDLDRTYGIATIQPAGPLQKSDFENIAKQLDDYIEERGDLAGLIIHTETFPGWKDFGALINHLKFINDHHKKIRKIAPATNSDIASILPKIANHFVNAEIRSFDYDEYEEAKAWIMEE
ncbi:MAG TPA: STAS/SEC14 domain-containing protein [Gammaproteobacteria bacterium]|nr:STAS/SEC14 domain-containing protein [Gammaproteobacteria bacterium]